MSIYMFVLDIESRRGEHRGVKVGLVEAIDDDAAIEEIWKQHGNDWTSLRQWWRVDADEVENSVIYLPD